MVYNALAIDYELVISSGQDMGHRKLGGTSDTHIPHTRTHEARTHAHAHERKRAQTCTVHKLLDQADQDRPIISRRVNQLRPTKSRLLLKTRSNHEPNSGKLCRNTRAAFHITSGPRPPPRTRPSLPRPMEVQSNATHSRGSWTKNRSSRRPCLLAGTKN